jgi:hypothetical protein
VCLEDASGRRLIDGQTIPAGGDGKSYRSKRFRIRLGHGSVDVFASLKGNRLTTTVRLATKADLTVGAVLPAGKRPVTVTYNGKPVAYTVVQTTRGTEVHAAVGGSGSLTVIVR